MPIVSVITPCYNSSRFVAETILSVRAQTMTDWEQVVVDDGSIDESAAIIETLSQQDSRLRLVRQPNGGVSSARNAGRRAMSSDSRYVFFLDADDLLEPQMLQTFVTYLDEHPEVGLLYCDPTFIDADGAVLAVTPTEMGWSGRFESTRLGVRPMAESEPRTPFHTVFGPTTIIPSIAIMRTSVYDQTPGWDESFGHLYEDLDLFLQVALRAEVHHLPRRLVRYRRHPAQSTADPDRVLVQDKKLLAKWRSMSGLSPRESAIVRHAFWFRQYRVGSYIGLRQAAQLARGGSLAHATWFFAGAVRRYAASFVNAPPALECLDGERSGHGR